MRCAAISAAPYGAWGICELTAPGFRFAPPGAIDLGPVPGLWGFEGDWLRVPMRSPGASSLHLRPVQGPWARWRLSVDILHVPAVAGVAGYQPRYPRLRSLILQGNWGWLSAIGLASGNHRFSVQAVGRRAGTMSSRVVGLTRERG